jgi:hypothetical protein
MTVELINGCFKHQARRRAFDAVHVCVGKIQGLKEVADDCGFAARWKPADEYRRYWCITGTHHSQQAIDLILSTQPSTLHRFYSSIHLFPI